MKYLVLGLATISLLGCESLTLGEDYKARNALLVQISKGEKMMEAGLAEQATGTALVAKGKATYQEGKALKDSAIEELNNSY